MKSRHFGDTSSFLRAIALAGAVATLLSSAGCSPSNDRVSNQASGAVGNVTLTAEQRSAIHLYTVVLSKFHKITEASGVVDFDNDQATSVLAPISGPVSQLLVSPGEQVKRGQTLALVDSPDFASAVSAYRKAVSAAQTARRLADLDKDLLAHKGVAQREADQAETDAVSTEADRNAALQALVALNLDPQLIQQIRSGRTLSRQASAIRSPLSGTVVERLITPGALLQAGSTPCFTVADLSRVWVMTQIFGSDLGSISVGDPAQVMTGIGSQTLAGRVDNIAAEVDPSTRSVAVRVAVANPAGLLKKQMYVRVQIQARAESLGLLVPVSAVLRDDENLPFVYVAQRDGSFARRHVTLGDRIGDRYEIAEGLHGGDRVVADGAIFVQFLQDQ
jgi:cobalt-zinc-cadmium efflux system membrane fusion protein